VAESSTNTSSHTSAPPDSWAPPVSSGPLDARIRIPGSKSLTNRAYVLAALAAEPTRILRPLDSRDTRLMLRALRALGADYELGDTAVDVHPLSESAGEGSAASAASADKDMGAETVTLGNAGTVARFTPAVAALGTRSVHFDGDPAIRRRPIGPLLRALTDIGVDIDTADNAGLPFTVHGTGSLPGGTVELDSSASSQFLSALLLIGPRCRDGISVRLVGDAPPSEPNIAMTLQALRDFGAGASSDGTEFRVPAATLHGGEFTVEPDLSTAAPFAVAPLVAGGSVHVSGWPHATNQPGDHLRELLPRLGATVEHDAYGLTITGSGPIRAAELDLRECSELVPVVAALLCLADGPSRLRGIAHMSGHETDRLAALATELSALGPRVTETEDGLAIEPAPLRPGVFHSYDDHRLVMAGALLAMRRAGIQVSDPATVGKTFPDFTQRWQQMVDSGSVS